MSDSSRLSWSTVGSIVLYLYLLPRYFCLSVSRIAYRGISVFLYFCISVFLYFCISVFLYFCISVFLYFCISVFLYFCISVVTVVTVVACSRSRHSSLFAATYEEIKRVLARDQWLLWLCRCVAVVRNCKNYTPAAVALKTCIQGIYTAV